MVSPSNGQNSPLTTSLANLDRIRKAHVFTRHTEIQTIIATMAVRCAEVAQNIINGKDSSTRVTSYACDTSMDSTWQVIATEEVSVVVAEDAEDAAVGEDAVEAITRPIATPTTAAPTVLSGQAIATNAIHTVPIRPSTHVIEVVLVQGHARGHAPDGPAAIGRGLDLRAIAIVREIHISKNK